MWRDFWGMMEVKYRSRQYFHWNMLGAVKKWMPLD